MSRKAKRKADIHMLVCKLQCCLTRVLCVSCFGILLFGDHNEIKKRVDHIKWRIIKCVKRMRGWMS